jgi:hypothetical protein
MFLSATVNWSTPQKFFDQYNQKCQFNLDVCALSLKTQSVPFTLLLMTMG